MKRTCDVCRLEGVSPAHDAIVDRATTLGQWSYLCLWHNFEVGIGPATDLTKIRE